MKIYYERNLPHFQPAGAAFFVTFRLKNSIPQVVLKELQSQKVLLEKGLVTKEEIHAAHKKYFALYDQRLDENPNGPYWLAEDKIASVVAGAFHFYDGKFYHLHCYTVMSNHVHLLFTHLHTAPELFKILQRIKRYTAIQSNKLLKRTGNAFWETESYDHVVRNGGEFNRIMSYILNNPVKAGLVENWEDWPWSFCDGGSEVCS